MTSTYRYLIVGTGYCARLLNKNRKLDWLQEWEETDDEEISDQPLEERLRKRGFIFIDDRIWGNDLTVIKEDPNIEELRTLDSFCCPYVLEINGDLTKAIKTLNRLMEADYCAFFDFGALIETKTYTLKDGSTAIYFHFDTESG